MEENKFCSIIYFRHINTIGGIETWLYQLAKKYSDYDITIFYKTGDANQIKRLKKYVRCVKYKDQHINCKKAFFNFNLDIIDNVEADEYIQIAHGDYKSMGVKPNTHPKITKYIGVSQLVCDTFKEVTGFDTELCYNPIEINKPKKVLHLLSATRLTKEKGKNRIIKLAQMLNNAGIPYIWTIFTNDTKVINIPNVVYVNPRLDITNYIADADYLVQLSDNEGYCYSVVESLILGTPVIVTDMPVMKEIGVVDGLNGFILDFNLSNLNIDKIYKGLPKFEYKPKEDNWGKFLEKGKSNYKEEIELKNYKVKVIRQLPFTDIEENITRKKDDIFLCTKERYEFLKENNAVELIEVIVSEEKEVKEPAKIIKEVPKKQSKKKK